MRTMRNRTERPRRRLARLTVALVLAAAVWANNTSLFSHRSSELRFLAHRGLAQTFDESQATWDSNTATMIDPIRHGFIENTIPSMRAAFAYGADTVELDVKLSKDGRLAVFHDSTLEYRTGVVGEVQDFTMAELKGLDVGYGYTADGGATYPLRGTGVGLMPSLDEVFAEFPTERFVIEVKDGKPATYDALGDFLATMDAVERSRLSVCAANDEGADRLRERLPDLRLLSKDRLTRALVEYELIGWTGYVPASMRGLEARIPLKYARFLWG